MVDTIKLLHATASGNVPASLVSGQIGIEEFTGKLFWRQNTGTVTPFPLLAPTNSLLGNVTGSTAAPVFLTTAQVMTALGAAPLASPTFTGTVTLSGTTVLAGAFADKTYTIATPLVAGMVTISAATGTQIINPAGGLASLTIAFPASPVDGLRFQVATTQPITVLTCSASTGTIKNAPTTLSAGAGFEYVYTAASTTWFRLR